MCKYKIKKKPFAFAKTSIQTYFHVQSIYPANKEAQNLSFWGLWLCNASLNKFPFARAKTQSKHTFIFTAATHKQRCNIAAFAPYVGKNCGSEAVCLVWCTNVECASAPPEAKLQRSAAENRRGHKHRVLQCTHSARTVHATVHATVRDHKTL